MYWGMYWGGIAVLYIGGGACDWGARDGRLCGFGDEVIGGELK